MTGTVFVPVSLRTDGSVWASCPVMDFGAEWVLASVMPGSGTGCGVAAPAGPAAIRAPASRAAAEVMSTVIRARLARRNVVNRMVTPVVICERRTLTDSQLTRGRSRLRLGRLLRTAGRRSLLCLG